MSGRAPAETRVPRRSWLILAVIVIAFLAVRLPVMYRQAGGQDESDFAVPGWTILREGVPRIPYMPSRYEKGVFYKADVALFTLPPAYFYWQAGFYAVFGPSHGTARLASTAAGLVAVWLVYWLGRQLYRDERAALWAAGLYSLSRVFYFPCLFARPDMLCGAVGLGAIACTWKWSRTGLPRWVAAAGALVGLGMLTHPFAIVYAMQVGAWVLFGGSGWKGRIRDVALLGVTSAAVFACWLPLILAYPEVFRVQFFNNVLDRSGPGLLQRLVLPFGPLRYQGELLLEHAGVWQLGLMAGGLLAATAHDLRAGVRRASPGPVTAVVLAWTATYLLIACQGEHPTKGYWCYPGAFLFLCVGRMVSVVSDRLRGVLPRPALWCGAALLIALLLPGAGLRATATHVRHWSDEDYDSRRFIRRVLKDLPPDARLLVDPAHVFETYLEGRTTVAAKVTPFSFDATGVPYDALIACRYDLEQGVPGRLRGRLVRAYGRSDEPFACYAVLYRPEVRGH